MKAVKFENAVNIYRERLRNAMQREIKDSEAGSSPASLSFESSVKPRLDSEWLRHLHKEHHTRFLHDNNRIWTSAQFLIPAALVPFGALASFKEIPSYTTVSLFALVSVTLVLFWYVTAEGHKAFQEKNWAWMLAIEEELGLITKDTPQRVFKGNISHSIFLQPQDVLPMARQFMVLFLLLAWIATLILFPTKP